MEDLKLWISGICIVSLIIVILKSLIPENSVGKTFNVTAALVIVFVTIAPIMRFDFADFDFSLMKNDESIKNKVEETVSKTKEITDKIIEERLREYICNKTGLEPKEIYIECENGEVKYVNLHKENTAVREMLKNDCGLTDDKIRSGV